MKRLIFLLLCFLALPVHLFAQAEDHSIVSLKLGERRSIKVSLPKSYDKEKSYPLFVVLDAEYLFDLVVANTKFYSALDEMPESIIVGIPQQDTRTDDLYFSDADGLPSEQGEAFFEFISHELLSQLSKEYKLTNFKAIVGHDLSANYLNYYLFKSQPIFDAYISLSPSLAPEMENHIPSRLAGINEIRFYYLATSPNDDKSYKDRIALLHQNIASLNNPKLHYYFDNLNNPDHYSVAAYGLPRALDKIFKIYKPISVEEYQKEVVAYNGPVYEYLIKKYGLIEELFEFRKPMSLNDFMAIYSAALKKEDLTSLNELSKIAKKEYPDTMLGFYLEAEFLERSGEPKKALRTYEKAFGMQEIDFLTRDHAMQRIDQIKQDFGW